MATVANLANDGGPIPNFTSAVDRALTAPNRTLATSPVGVTTPGYIGEIVFDQSTTGLWKAYGLANTDWAPYEAQRS